MLLILAYWLYLLALTSVFGLLFQKIFKFKEIHPSLTLMLGGFAISIVATLWTLFGGLNSVFDICLIIACCVVAFFLRKDLRFFIMNLKDKLRSLSPFLKIIFTMLTLFVAAKSTGIPFILDNESYYIQTIKWLDNFGLVKGLANLHPFLAQTSGWHMLQSSLNLNNWFLNLNDLNGFYLCIANFYALSHLNEYKRSKDLSLLFIGSFFIFNVFLFQFVDAPSPDLAIYICTFFIFSEFLKESIYPSEANKKHLLLFSIAVFASFIKVTAVLLLLFPLILIIRDRTFSRNDSIKLSSLGIMILLLFVVRNYIISGYPLYPLQIFGSEGTMWKLPGELYHFITHQTKLYGFFMSEEQFAASSSFQRFIHWLMLPGLHGFFNKMMVLFLALFPIVIWKTEYKKTYTILFVFCALQLGLSWLGSPQYRFFFGALMLLIMATFVTFFKKQVYFNSLLIVSLFLVAIPLIYPLPLNALTKNNFQNALVPFSLEHLVIPAESTRYTDTRYVKIIEGNLRFHTPVNVDFFWASGDGPLPCVQAVQIDYFKENYKLLPQQIGAEISEGFYSLQLTNE